MSDGFFSKLVLTLRVIRNLHTFVLDFFGLIGGTEVVYTTWSGLKFFTRVGTPDKAEIIIVCGGSEYPAQYFPSGKDLVVLDIGAHIGSFSAYISGIKRGDQPRVYAIEPSQDNFRYLSRNMKLNHFDRVKCFNVAIGSKNGFGYIDMSKDFDALTVDNEEVAGADSSHSIEKCQVMTLETFCQKEQIGKIDLLKMDCEGSEHGIFNTSLPFIKQNIRFFFVEVHYIPGQRTVSEFKQFLIENNFSVEAEICERTFFVRNLNIS